MFQHTATRRWLRAIKEGFMNTLSVSTHSHPKVAAGQLTGGEANTAVSTHSHPKVAAESWANDIRLMRVSTHSHPKVAANSI